MYTPERIEELTPDQVFVFGSNANGHHGGGAASLAHQKFGAKWGIGEGLRGQSYAFPTLNKGMTKCSLEGMCAAKIDLYATAECNPDKTFLVTKLGLGIAGHGLETMQEVFVGSHPKNIVLPIEFSGGEKLGESVRIEN